MRLLGGLLKYAESKTWKWVREFRDQKERATEGGNPIASPNADWEKGGGTQKARSCNQIVEQASIRNMIPDFKGHHFVEDLKPDEPPSWHHCERCGMKALLRPNGSTYFDVAGSDVLTINAGVPLDTSLVPRCR